jgi:hypothetical protein
MNPIDIPEGEQARAKRPPMRGTIRVPSHIGRSGTNRTGKSERDDSSP